MHDEESDDCDMWITWIASISGDKALALIFETKIVIVVIGQIRTWQCECDDIQAIPLLCQNERSRFKAPVDKNLLP